MDILNSIIIWVVGTFLTALLFLVELVLTIILFPFDKKRKVIHAQCFWWSDILIGMNSKWNIALEGQENIDKKETYVIVANHESIGDIIVLYKTRLQFKWVAKESLFKVPFIGWCLSLSKHIKLRRGDFSSIKQVYKEAAGWLRKDVSVFFFPEGTRSETEEMNEFQNGPFKLAIKEKRAILPIVIQGSREIIPKGSWIFTKKVDGKITVLPPVSTKDMASGDFRALKDKVRAQIEATRRS